MRDEEQSRRELPEWRRTLASQLSSSLPILRVYKSLWKGESPAVPMGAQGGLSSPRYSTMEVEVSTHHLGNLQCVPAAGRPRGLLVPCSVMGTNMAPARGQWWPHQGQLHLQVCQDKDGCGLPPAEGSQGPKQQGAGSGH